MTIETAYVPPHSLEAEQAVLGAIVLHNAALAEVVDRLQPVHFYRQAHQRIYEAIRDLATRDVEIDLVSLKHELAKRGWLDDVGGPAYLAKLVDGVPRSSNVLGYSRILCDLAARRAIVTKSRTLAEEALEGDVDPQALLQAASADLAKMAEGLPAGYVGHDPDLERELRRERARREACRQIEAENRGRFEPPQLLTLRERLARPRVPRRHRIAELQPQSTRVLLVAQFKAGKTTLVQSLVRSLVDREPFLNRYDASPIRGQVVILDTEMNEVMTDEWYRDAALVNDDRLIIESLQGRVASLDILDRQVRSHWAGWLKAKDASYLILDCLRPVLDALGLDENKDAGRFLVQFDALLAEAGISEALIVHHAGHGGERARGDSRLRDWPDAEWRLLRQDQDDPSSARFFTAYGRDVDQAEVQLAFNPKTRRLSVAGGSRRDSAAAEAIPAIERLLEERTTPLSGRQIKGGLSESGIPRAAIEAGLRLGARRGEFTKTQGERGAVMYGLTVPVSQSVPAVSQDSPSECPAAYIRRDAGTLDRNARLSRAFVEPERERREHAERLR